MRGSRDAVGGPLGVGTGTSVQENRQIAALEWRDKGMLALTGRVKWRERGAVLLGRTMCRKKK